jgi:hypothetical protein
MQLFTIGITVFYFGFPRSIFGRGFLLFHVEQLYKTFLKRKLYIYFDTFSQMESEWISIFFARHRRVNDAKNKIIFFKKFLSCQK